MNRIGRGWIVGIVVMIAVALAITLTLPLREEVTVIRSGAWDHR